MSEEHIATYLNDHLSGAVAAIELIDHPSADVPEIKPAGGTRLRTAIRSLARSVDVLFKFRPPECHRVRSA